MTNELPLTHYSRQWLGLVAAKAKIQPRHRGERWLLHLTLGNPHARTVTLHLRIRGRVQGVGYRFSLRRGQRTWA